MDVIYACCAFSGNIAQVGLKPNRPRNFGEVYEGGRWYEDVVRKSIKNDQLVLCRDDRMVLDEDDREAAIKEALRIGVSELAERLLPPGSILDYATYCTRPEIIAKVLGAECSHWNEQQAAKTQLNAAQRGSCELMQQILQLHSPFREDHSRRKSARYNAVESSLLGWQRVRVGVACGAPVGP